MKAYKCFELFNRMMMFAIDAGMVSYQSDLMHDAVALVAAEESGEPCSFVFIVKGNGCGTWMWNVTANPAIPECIADSGAAKALISYDGSTWGFAPIV